MAIFSRRLRQTNAANTQVTLQALVEHVIYMQDALERRDKEISELLDKLKKAQGEPQKTNYGY